MKVKFHSIQKLAGQAYGAGEAVVADKLAHTQEFKRLVQAGHVSIVPRTEAEQKVQAGKDAHAVRKAAQAFAAHKAAEPKQPEAPAQADADGEEVEA